MVKKRYNRTPPNASRVKTEDREAKSPLSGDDVKGVARDRLKGALQFLIDRSDDDTDTSQDERSVTPPPVKSSPVKREQRRQIRRSKKKPSPEPDQAFHHAFVMKLFDRSVDLAQFTEDTPLYPICRAWMANKPRIPVINNDVKPSADEMDIKIEAENGMTDEQQSSDADELSDVNKLPTPVGLPVSRIPTPEPTELQGITPETFEMGTNRNTLLSEHMIRWAKVRHKWLEAAQANEGRYAESGAILTNMFQSLIVAAGIAFKLHKYMLLDMVGVHLCGPYNCLSTCFMLAYHALLTFRNKEYKLFD